MRRWYTYSHCTTEWESPRLLRLNALVSGKPRTPIPGECGSLAGDFSGFKWSSLPQCAGCSTTLDTNNSDRGPLAGLAGLWRGFRFWIGLQRTLGKRMISKWRPPTRRYVQFKIHSFHALQNYVLPRGVEGAMIVSSILWRHWKSFCKS